MTTKPKRMRRSYWHECVVVAINDPIVSEMTIEELVTATVQIDRDNARPIAKPDKRREVARRAVNNLITQGTLTQKPGNIIVLL